jgi:NADPH:quinone reductase-like Zn-dependent oxidoreductase
MAERAKIVRFHKGGGPEVLQVEELSMPKPAAGEVRLRVKAIGLNRAEVMYPKLSTFTATWRRTSRLERSSSQCES